MFSCSYFREMPWVALDYRGNDELKVIDFINIDFMPRFFSRKTFRSHIWLQGFIGTAFGVKSIPTLILVDVKTGAQSRFFNGSVPTHYDGNAHFMTRKLAEIEGNSESPTFDIFSR